MTGSNVTTLVSLNKPQNFDWEITRSFNFIPATDSSSAVLHGVKDPSYSRNPALLNESDKGKEKEDGAASSSPVTLPYEGMSTKKAEDKKMGIDVDLEDGPSSLRGAYSLQ